MATIVDPSLAALQVFALIAAVLFAVGTVAAIMGRATVAALTLGGLLCLALALLFT
jgi:hypothetical protein